MVLTWHHMHDRFYSPKAMKLKLMEDFTEFVPSDINFHVGYFEGKASAKKWIVSSEDCNAMYDAHWSGDQITIWCDAKEKGASRKQKTMTMKQKQLHLQRERKERKRRVSLLHLQRSMQVENTQNLSLNSGPD